MTTPSYTVYAIRWAHGWELHIVGVGVTQAHSLGDDAEAAVRDYISLERGLDSVDRDAFAVNIIVAPPAAG